jgi:acetyl-CoA C-acetyltransferase
VILEQDRRCKVVDRTSARESGLAGAAPGLVCRQVLRGEHHVETECGKGLREGLGAAAGGSAGAVSRHRQANHHPRRTVTGRRCCDDPGGRLDTGHLDRLERGHHPGAVVADRKPETPSAGIDAEVSHFVILTVRGRPATTGATIQAAPSQHGTGGHMREIVILSSARTPIGSFLGALATVPAPRLGAAAIRAALARAGVSAENVEQVVMGNVLQAGIGQAPARQAGVFAGVPHAAGAVTVHKVCGSGLKAVMYAANDIRCGEYDLAVAGGMESMSLAPYLLPQGRTGYRMGTGQVLDHMVFDGLWDPYGDKHMGNCAETCVRHYGFTREAQDEFARLSYERARSATEDGLFAAEIVPVEVPARKGEVTVVDRDEEPYRSDLAKMPKLRPAFEKDGTVTAANASKINDGAAALVVASAERAAELGVKPVARIVAQGSVAQEPEWFTTAPIGAIRKVAERAGLGLDEIELYEINEAFAAVAMATMHDLGLPLERVNVHGGAVAMGHPIGASGARILTTLLHALAQRNARLGCAAICIGGGEAAAMIVERLA